MFIFKKALLYILFALVFVGGLFVSVDTIPDASNSFLSFEFGIAEAYASTGTVATDNVSKALDGFVGIFNLLLGVITVLVTPFVMFAGWLLSPDWVSGRIFGLQKPMYDLWRTIANIVYFIYAMALIIIAIATIFNSQNYGYKALLPKLFVGIVLVPFTWWFVQFVISVGTFTTSAVLQIPAETINRLDDKNAFWTTESIPKEITVDTIFRTYDAIKADCKEKGNCISPKNFVMEGGGIYSPILAYAYSIFKIDKLKVINTNAVDLTMNITSLFSDLMIAGIMFVIFGIIVIALVAILFVRVVILWLYAMFSPLFTFQYVFGGKLGKNEGLEYFKVSELIATAFIPMIVGLILSFGLIVVASVKGGMSATVAQSSQSCSVAQLKGEGCIIMTIMGNSKNKIYYKLSPDDAQKVGDNQTKAGEEQLKTITTVEIGGVKMMFSGVIEKNQNILDGDSNLIGRLGSIVVQFIAIIFVWLAFTTVGRVTRWTGKIVEPIASLSKQIGMSGVKSIKLPGVGSVGGAMKMPEIIQNKVREKNIDYHNDLAHSSIGRMLGVAEQQRPSSPRISAQINTGTTISSITVNSTGQATVSGLESAKQTMNAIATENYSTVSTMQKDMKHYFTSLIEETKQKAPNGKVTDAVWRAVLEKAQLHGTGDIYTDLLAWRTANDSLDATKIDALLKRHIFSDDVMTNNDITEAKTKLSSKMISRM